MLDALTKAARSGRDVTEAVTTVAALEVIEADAALMLVVLCKERFSFGTHKPSALNRPLGQVFSAGGFLRKLAFVGNPKSLSV